MPTKVREAASQAALDEAGVLIDGLSSAEGEAVRKILSEALYHGWTSAKTAGRIQQVVGLSDRDQAAVRAYRQRLKDAGRTDHHADTQATAYAARLRKRRSRLIADYEVRRSVGDAQRQQWAQDQHDGKISAYAVRVFHTSKDERTCPTCAPLNGRRTSLRSSTPAPPMHPNCRCYETLVDGVSELGTTTPSKAMIRKAIRRVRSPEGVQRYNLPIGAPIAPGSQMTFPEVALAAPEVPLEEQREEKRKRLVQHTTGYRVEKFLQVDNLREFAADMGLDDDYLMDDELIGGLASQLAERDWAYFGACREIRTEAARMVRALQTEHDPHRDSRSGTDFAWGPGAIHVKPQAALLLAAVNDAGQQAPTLYRGVSRVPRDAFKTISEAKKGQEVDLPLVSFVNSRNEATSFGDEVVFIVKAGARAVVGGQMSNYTPPDLEPDSDEWYDWLEYDAPNEHITGGRFKIERVRKRASGLTVTLVQVGTFDPITGEVNKTGVAKGNMDLNIPPWDNLFDTALAKPKPKKKGVSKAKAPCFICGRPMSDPVSIARGYGPSHTRPEAAAVLRSIVHSRNAGTSVPEFQRLQSLLQMDGDDITYHRQYLASLDSVAFERAVDELFPGIPRDKVEAKAEAFTKLKIEGAKMKRGKVTVDLEAEGLPDETVETMTTIFTYDRDGISTGDLTIIRSFDDGVVVNGGIFTEGKKIGTFTRRFDMETGQVEHALFKILPDIQGQGWMQGFFDQMMEGYIENDFESIYTGANIDVGGYAWARKGFEWGRVPDKVLIAFKGILNDETAPGWLQDQVVDLQARINNGEVPTAWEIANLGRREWDDGDRWEPDVESMDWRRMGAYWHTFPPPGDPDRPKYRTYNETTWASGFHVGKAILLGSTWSGYMNLNDYEVVKAGDDAPTGVELFKRHTQWVEAMLERDTPFASTHKKSDYNLHHLDVDGGGDDLFDDIVCGYGDVEKRLLRRVRSLEGARRFGRPIGSPILPGEDIATRARGVKRPSRQQPKGSREREEKKSSIRRLLDMDIGGKRLETHIQRITDTIGVDPYDVDMKKLKAHCEEHERAPQSRFFFKSPCYHMETVDFSVHRVLPAMLREKYPEMARRLEKTSPRWGHVPIAKIAHDVMKALKKELGISEGTVEKIRRVRTPEGAKFFDAPIGTPITPGMAQAARDRRRKKQRKKDEARSDRVMRGRQDDKKKRRIMEAEDPEETTGERVLQRGRSNDRMPLGSQPVFFTEVSDRTVADFRRSTHRAGRGQPVAIEHVAQVLRAASAEPDVDRAPRFDRDGIVAFAASFTRADDTSHRNFLEMAARHFKGMNGSYLTSSVPGDQIDQARERVDDSPDPLPFRGNRPVNLAGQTVDEDLINDFEYVLESASEGNRSAMDKVYDVLRMASGVLDDDTSGSSYMGNAVTDEGIMEAAERWMEVTPNTRRRMLEDAVDGYRRLGHPWSIDRRGGFRPQAHSWRSRAEAERLRAGQPKKEKRKRGKIEWDPEDRALSGKATAIIKGIFTYSRPRKDGGGTIRSRVNEVYSSGGGEVHVMGSILFEDETGEDFVVGEFDRKMNLESGRVYHALFTINHEHQGQGFMEHWFDNVFDQYIENEFEQVSVGANIDIGGYAWARKGFTWRNREGPPRKVRRALKKIADGDDGFGRKIDAPPWLKEQAQALHDRIQKGGDDMPTAQEIADLGRAEWVSGDRWEPDLWEERSYGGRQRFQSPFGLYVSPEDHRNEIADYSSGTYAGGYHIGKALLLGTSWTGYIRLEDIKKAEGGLAMFRSHVAWVDRMEDIITQPVEGDAGPESDLAWEYIDLWATPEQEAEMGGQVKKALDRGFRHQDIFDQYED